MFLNIILIIVILIILFIIGSILYRKLPQLKMIEPDEMHNYREDKIKKKILEKKLQSDVSNFWKKMIFILKPIASYLSKTLKKIYTRIYRLEEKYKNKLLKTHFEDKISVESRILKHIEQADVFVENKDFDKAEAEYINALKLDMHNMDIYKKLADLYFQNKDYEKAKETYEYILRIKDDDYSYSRLGDISKNKGDLNQAANNYSKSLTIDANNPMHYYNLAKINLKLDQIEDALENINKALNIESESPKFLDFLLDLSIIMKDKDLANKTLLKLKGANPDNNKILKAKEKIDNI
jgi:tetratricopeptide (TPR) repeat protein